jgi:phosphatidylglycerophosphate synthase
MINRYTYYALAALGRHEVLWWKKYLTQMQMIQFILITLHALYFLFHPTCNWPKIFPALEACHGILFFYLFYSFYKRSYQSENDQSSTVSSLITNGIAIGSRDNNNSVKAKVN